MDTTGTFEMARALGRHKMMTALHKHYEADQYIDFFKSLESEVRCVLFAWHRRGGV